MKPKRKKQIDKKSLDLCRIEKLFSVVEELYVRETSNNVLVNLGWDELCDEGIELFKKLKGGIDYDNVS